MKIHLLTPLLFFGLASSTLAADPAPATAAKPGRYILIMYSEKPGYLPEPVIVQIRAGNADSLSIEAEDAPQSSSPMQPEGIGLDFSIKIPRKEGLDVPGTDRASARIMHFFAGHASKSRPDTFEGVFSEFRPYYSSFNPPPQVTVGTFLLFSIGTK